MKDDTFNIASRVRDESSFLAFLDQLAKDRADECRKEELQPSSPYGAGANGWQNGSIETFLEAAAAWGQATADRPLDDEHPENPWQRCAQIISAGKFYE
jgi:hypothetical protein